MKTFAKLGTTLMVVLLVGLWTVVGNGAVGAKKSVDKVAAGKAETYVVVKVGDEPPAIMTKSEYTNLKKSTKEEYDKAKKDYAEAKKAAKTKEDKAALGKAPTKTSLKQMGGTFKTEDKAREWLEKHADQDSGEKGGKKAPQ
jgi:hypothetical protein